MEEPGWLQSMGSQRVGHNERLHFTLHFRDIYWRRKWQPTPVFLPGKSHEWRSLVGYSPWGRRVGHHWATSLSLYFHFSVCWNMLLDNVFLKEDSENVGLKCSIQKTKIMASSPITSCQTDGETMETVTDFIFLGSKITANGGCSHEIKRCLLLEEKLWPK